MKKRTKKATQTPTTKPIVTQTGKIPNSVGFCHSFNFTKAAVTILLLVLFTSCGGNDELPIEYTQKEMRKIIVVHIEDYSKSVDGVKNYFDTSTVAHLISSLSTADEATAKLIGVYENSVKQNVFTLHILHYPDTTSTQEINIYKKARINEGNKKLLTGFSEKLHSQISQYCTACIKPHTEQYTDLASALSLAQMTLNQPIYSKEHRKYLLICSDMVNDLRGKRFSKLKPVLLPRTTVLIVRPTLTETELAEIFPASHVYMFSDVNDAIEMIK